ncbi:hypothetical protein E4T38_00990 [Aureobasidium subglaciale]|nr:hypothetical protein E4T38_00990 [Aureobasidium subglaciale]KAI5230777.1 hypothetical protein E4T40_00991 [Aureobasidium subglaciale]KAI5233798.1 hypothetical protein E4T41_00989 [Aureobasidium subglaciale]KAI5267290.1 hypothetical protein E4T46_00989 [Aureobasidium subglaciale]
MSFHNASGCTFLALLIGSPHIRIYLATLGGYFALSPIPSFSSHTYVEESKVAHNCQPTGIHEYRLEITMLREMSIYLWLHKVLLRWLRLFIVPSSSRVSTHGPTHLRQIIAPAR